ncbi:MAG: DUF1559 domain-containing protein [Candidatus Omnitrophica bacterium]|nr:DUF1559 domain-containing protein [Candidatus Omnitrophota bacterium]
MNNLKQCGLALYMYANDYEEYLPPMRYNEGGWFAWNELIIPYLFTGKKITDYQFGVMKTTRSGSKPIMACQSARPEIKTRNSDTYTYGVNYGWRDDTFAPFGIYITNTSYKGSKKLSQIKNQKCFLVTDATNIWILNIILDNPFDIDTDGDGIKDSHSGTSIYFPRSWYNYLAPRHSKGLNALLADGSVKYIPFLEFITNLDYWRIR